jgi:mannose-1-phosphate guanylyltransferase/mannose-6-phosphate isomerase
LVSSRFSYGYGYIKKGRLLPYGAIVNEFKEKPDEKTAKEYVRKGYLWNSGIFLLSTDCFFAELKKYRPELSEAFSADQVPDYSKLESISIDYGLLEQSEKVAVVTLETQWSDLGTFGSHDAESDSAGNISNAEYFSRRIISAPW